MKVSFRESYHREPQLSSPTSIDKMKANVSSNMFSEDVKDAHRPFPIDPIDWHLLACGKPGENVYVNVTWHTRCSRGLLATAAVREAHCVLHELASWLLLVADDLAVFFHVRESVLLDLACFRVDNELLLSEAAPGLSASRALLLEEWYTRLLRDWWCACSGVGRAAFVCGALDYDGPFLAPLFASAARHAPASVKPLPLCALVTLDYLRRKTSSGGTANVECSGRAGAGRGGWTPTDGGWWPVTDDKVRVSTWESPWFALKVTPANAPWAFQRNGLLEAWPCSSPSYTKTTVWKPGFTNKWGNGYVVDKLMTTRFPLCASIMELAAQPEQRRVRMEAEWTPRDRKQEADDLSNLRTSRLDPEKEVFRKELEAEQRKKEERG